MSNQNPYAYQPDQPTPEQAQLTEDQVTIERGGFSVMLSWLAILVVTIGLFGLNVFGPMLQEPSTEASGSELMQVNMMGKMLVGQTLLGGEQEVDAQIEDQLDQMNIGSLEQRYGIVLLTNELIDADRAQKLLNQIDGIVVREQYEPTENQARLRTIVGDLVDQYRLQRWDSSTIAKDDREFFVGQLGWVGQLGLTPKDSPNSSARQSLEKQAFRTMLVLICMCLGIGLGLLVGVGLFITFVVLLSKRKFKSLYPTPNRRPYIYLETFAIWMIVFVLAQFAVGWLATVVNLDGPFVGSALTLLIFFGSLGVLVWPKFRGIPFSQIREDIGWKMQNPFKEVGAGIASYIAMMPALAVAFIVVILLMTFMATFQTADNSLAPTGGAIHPIQDQIATGNPLVWLGVFLTACVAAPIVEETLFRGVFYRYLRGSTFYKARWFSVIFACLVNGLIFASIHPQGIVGIPLLTTLAVGMSLAREWRGSLVASMTMHAINNSLVTCLMFSIF